MLDMIEKSVLTRFQK